MTTNIKEYKQLLTIELKDGTILNTDKTLQQLQDYLSKWSDFITIDGVMFNKYEFKKAYERKVNDIEQYIMSKDRDTQKMIRFREKQMFERVWRTWENIEHIDNWLKNWNDKIPL